MAGLVTAWSAGWSSVVSGITIATSISSSPLRPATACTAARGRSSSKRAADRVERAGDRERDVALPALRLVVGLLVRARRVQEQCRSRARATHDDQPVAGAREPPLLVGSRACAAVRRSEHGASRSALAGRGVRCARRPLLRAPRPGRSGRLGRLGLGAGSARLAGVGSGATSGLDRRRKAARPRSDVARPSPDRRRAAAAGGQRRIGRSAIRTGSR